MTDTTDHRAKLTELIRGFRAAMLTTPHPDGTLSSRPCTMQETGSGGEVEL